MFGGYNRQVVGASAWRRVSWVPWPVPRDSARGHWSPRHPRVGRAARRASHLVPRIGEVPDPGDKAQKMAAVLAADRFDDLYLGLAAAWSDPGALVGIDADPMGPTPAARTPEERMLNLDTAVTLPDGMLTKVDRASMAASLEVRVPLLDHRVVELAWRLPYAANVNRGVGKRLLRRVLDRYVPHQLVDRPKMGFDPPIGAWLRGPLRQWAADLLDPHALATAGINSAPVRQRWADHQAGKRNWACALWTVLMYQAWRETL